MQIGSLILVVLKKMLSVQKLHITSVSNTVCVHEEITYTQSSLNRWTWDVVGFIADTVHGMVGVIVGGVVCDH